MTQLDIPTAAARGEEIVIADAADRPVARLMVAVQPQARQFGTFRGRATVADDFDDALPPDALAEFHKWSSSTRSSSSGYRWTAPSVHPARWRH